MDEYVSETDSDYTSYWRDWVSFRKMPSLPLLLLPSRFVSLDMRRAARTDTRLVIVHLVPRKRILLRDRRGLPD
jgi:hypothetical protein